MNNKNELNTLDIKNFIFSYHWFILLLIGAVGLILRLNLFSIPITTYPRHRIIFLVCY